MDHYANANIGPFAKGANVSPYSHANVGPAAYVSKAAKGSKVMPYSQANVAPAIKGGHGYGPLAANAHPYGMKAASHSAGKRYTSTGAILVLFILLVIITRSKFYG